MDISHSFFFFHLGFIQLGFTNKVFNITILIVKSFNEYHIPFPSLEFFVLSFF